MSADWIAQAAPWVAIVFIAFAIAAAIAAATARSLVSMALSLFVCAALAATALFALGRAGAALDIALLAAGLAPCVILAVLLLSARATRLGKRAPPWVTIVAASVLCAVVFIGMPPLPPAPTQDAEIGLGFWLAPMVFVTAAACLGLLGFGERGALTRAQDGEGAP